jgi:hemerythrin-like domain-containing protein
MAATKQRITKAVKQSSRNTTTRAARRTSKAVGKRAVKAAKRSTSAKRATVKHKTAAAKPAAGSRAKVQRTTGAVKKRTAARKGSVRPKSGDAIAVLKADHRQVEQLFKRFEKAGDGAFRSKRVLVDSMIEDLSRHAAIEELVFYSAVRREVTGAEKDVLEALEEHHLVKVSLRELEDLDASDERFGAKVTVLIEHVRHHVKEEEQELFPDVRDRLGARRLQELGDELRAAKPRVPTRPHPAAPDEPPGNALIGGAVAVVDHARTVGKRVVDRVL